ncbi:MAG TPA: ABC transporter permease, partial [Gammaproteobacteria bacterium]|nr:ABC transporter permease [Gammaproteobacteria bacterium]
LGPDDDLAGKRVAVLSHRAWRRLFARDPAVVGRAVRLAGRPYLIVGVLQEGFDGTNLDGGADFRVLFANSADFDAPFPFTRILARLRGGESLESADAETRAIWSRFRESRAAPGGVVGPFDRDLSVELRSIARGTSRVRDQFRPTLLLLFGGAGLMLAMVCLNVGGLLLARITQARKDAAMRRALGASRLRIAGQWTAESLLVTAIGGAAGLALAAAAVPVLIRWLSPLIGFGSFGQAPALEVSFDLRIAAFGAGAMLGTGILAALVPVIWGAREDAYATLKASIDDRESRRIQSALTVVQIAISAVLLLGGGLLLHSLDRLAAVDPGFDRERLVRFELDPRLADYTGPAAAAFERRLLDEIGRLPSVEAAALTETPVMQGFGQVMVVSPPGGPPDVEGAWNTNLNRVTAGYFATMGIELSSGGVFDDEPASAEAFGNGQTSAVAPAPIPVVVNAAFARRFFGGEDAVGRVFDVGREFKKPTYRIVGVVADANYRSLREADPPICYMNPLSQPQTNAGAFSLLVRTTTPETVMGPVRSLVRSIDPALPVLTAVTMADEIDRSLWRERLAAALTSAFAMLGLAVAAVGLYAILANYVASRRKEIGLRLAIGAKGRDVLGLIVRRVAPIVLLGLLAGTAAHVALSRWLASLLYEVSALDPITVGLSAAALLLMALAAAAVPALRAISVDPARTLRED